MKYSLFRNLKNDEIKTGSKIKKRKSPILAVDGIILKNNRILLTKRNRQPFLDFWVLPGGHVEYGEKVEDAIKREMKEELGISVKIKKLFGVYSNPKRDPRCHTVTIVYLLEKKKGEIFLSAENKEYKYFSLNNLPRKIGFDHREIINNLINEYRKKKLERCRNIYLSDGNRNQKFKLIKFKNLDKMNYEGFY